MEQTGARAQVRADTGGVAIGRDVNQATINIGIPPEQLAALVRVTVDLSETHKKLIAKLEGDLDLNQRQIRAALDILGENNILPESLAAKLVEVAERFKDLRLPIATRTKKPARCCGATGQPRAKAARSKANARRGQSGGSRDGSMSICGRRYSSASTQTRKRCVSAVRRRTSVRHDEGANGRDALPDQDTAEGRSRNGARSSCVQSDPRHEHRRVKAVDARARELRQSDPTRTAA